MPMRCPAVRGGRLRGPRSATEFVCPQRLAACLLAAHCCRPLRPPSAARGLLREREERLAGLNRKAMALPPGRGGYTQQQQAAAWRDYLAWEQGNPQQLDAATYAAR